MNAHPATLMGNLEEAKAFLDALPHRTVNVCAIRPDKDEGEEIPAVTRPHGHPDLFDFVARHNGVRNVYFAVNEPKPDAPDRRLTKDDLALILYAQTDIDPDAEAPLAAERKRLLDLAEEHATHPLNPATIAIDSGGGVQLLYELEKPLPYDGKAGPNTLAVEAQSRGLAHVLGGDRGTHDVSRIMRVPGTVNLPDSRKRARGRVAAPARLLGGSGAPIAMAHVAEIAPPLAKAPKATGEDWTKAGFDWTAAETAEDMPEALRARLEDLRKRAPMLDAMLRGDNSRLPDKTGSGLIFGLIKALRSNDVGPTDAALVALTQPVTAARLLGMDEAKRRREIGRAWVNCADDLTSWKANEKAEESFTAMESTADGAIEVPVEKGPKRAPLTFEAPGDITLDFERYPLVDDLLDQGTIAMLYGESNVGKTFAAMAIAYAVARGIPWHDRRTEQGVVVYVAAEAGRSARRRVAALQRHYGVQDFPLLLVACPVDLLKPNGDTKPLVELIRGIEARFGKVVLVVIDTLAAATPGANENGSEDMGAFIANVKSVNAAIGCCILVVHHSGKDRAKGARGHSSLRASIDTELEIENGIISATKQRDMEYGAPIGFRLHSVALGHRPDGKVVTSAVAIPDGVDRSMDDFTSMTEHAALAEALGGRCWRADNQSSGWIGEPVAEAYGLDVHDPEWKARASRIIKDLIRTGALERAPFFDRYSKERPGYQYVPDFLR